MSEATDKQPVSYETFFAARDDFYRVHAMLVEAQYRLEDARQALNYERNMRMTSHCCSGTNCNENLKSMQLQIDMLQHAADMLKDQGERKRKRAC
jgi:hypothetical protein